MRSYRLRTTVVAGLIAASVSGLAAEPAAARPCSDRHPVFVDGVQWIVYAEGRVKCRFARRWSRRLIRGEDGPDGWTCKRRRQWCYRGDTYIDRYGNRRYHHLFGWHGAD